MDDDGVEVEPVLLDGQRLPDIDLRHNFVALLVGHRILKPFYAHHQVVGQLAYQVPFLRLYSPIVTLPLF